MKTKDKIHVSELGDIELCKVKGYAYSTSSSKKLELENKLNKLQNTIDAIGFFSLFHSVILITYIATKGF